jgi:hypothetical protein
MRANKRIITDPHGTKNARKCTYLNPISYDRMPLRGWVCCDSNCAEYHAPQHITVLTDFGGFPDNRSKSMIQHEAGANFCPMVDLGA